MVHARDAWCYCIAKQLKHLRQQPILAIAVRSSESVYDEALEDAFEGYVDCVGFRVMHRAILKRQRDEVKPHYLLQILQRRRMLGVVVPYNSEVLLQLLVCVHRLGDNPVMQALLKARQNASTLVQGIHEMMNRREFA